VPHDRINASLDLGDSLRQIRHSAGLTLAAVAERIGVSKGYLSKVESGAATPSIAVLSRLADAYGLPISDLFRDATARSAFAVVRADGRRAVNRHGTELGYVFEAVSLHKLNPRAEVFFLTLPPLPPDASHARYRHAGEEIFHVLEGQVRFVWGDQDVVLSAGDCIQFDPAIEHRGEALGDQPARAFVVIIPNTPHNQKSSEETRERESEPGP
jgi:transcriptional regulator with XRE-family HTH domain